MKEGQEERRQTHKGKEKQSVVEFCEISKNEVAKQKVVSRRQQQEHRVESSNFAIMEDVLSELRQLIAEQEKKIVQQRLKRQAEQGVLRAQSESRNLEHVLRSEAERKADDVLQQQFEENQRLKAQQLSDAKQQEQEIRENIRRVVEKSRAEYALHKQNAKEAKEQTHKGSVSSFIKIF